ncbi:hypothetical protein NGM10_05485 [Halorussus salilacus]|nr:hypothetical protein [Halorussus salilacus]USZ69192.1 hypothetical protein NGM10_05485 [Halorussus salilacus]
MVKSNRITFPWGESVGEALERLGDKLGWESLSEWPEVNLEGGEDEWG